MKNKIIFSAVLLFVLSVPSVRSQELKDRIAEHFTPYGFVRTYAVFDTREMETGSESMSCFTPKDKSLNRQGKDIYSNPSLSMTSVTTRLGVDVAGYEMGKMKTSAKVEADFNLYYGSAASLRLRHAYVDVWWDKLGYMENTITLRVGHTWHPMAADRPYCLDEDEGTPFGPSSRSPQVMINANLSRNWNFTGGVLYPSETLPVGPSGSTVNYVKYGMIPEAYLGASYSIKHAMVKAGVDFLSMKPRWRTLSTDNVNYDVGTPTKDRIYMFSPFLYAEMHFGNFRMNAKSVLGQGGSHMNLLGGYAITDDSDIYCFKYEPINTSSSFVSLSYGRKLQMMLMGGYMRNLGTLGTVIVDSDGDAYSGNMFYTVSSLKNIAQMFRATPAVAFNAGRHLTVAVEYDFMMTQFGNNYYFNSHCVPVYDLHWIMGNRVVGMVRWNF